MKKKINIIASIFCLLVTTVSIFAQANRGVGVRVKNEKTNKVEEVNLYKASYALVIGVSDYTNGWQNLPGVKSDVQAITNSLKAQGFQVTNVLNPKRAELSAAIEKFISDYGVDYENRLLIYYAGHGHTQKSGAGYEQGFIVPTDAPTPKAGNESEFRRMAISMDSIERYAQEIEAKHALFVFDSCFSGALLTKTRSTTPPFITFKTTQPVRQFITAGSDNQEVPDVSVFREQFVEGLKGAADLNADGFITASELADFLQDKVTSLTRGSQTPQYGKIRDSRLDKGDFVFALSSSVVKPNLNQTTAVQPNSTVSNEAAGELSFWNSIENSTDVRDFEEYLKSYPSGTYAATARLKVRKLSEAKPELPSSTNKTEVSSGSYRDLLSQADEAVVKNDTNGAIELLQKAISADNTKSAAYEQLGNVYYERKDYANAQQAMLLAIKNGGKIIFADVHYTHKFTDMQGWYRGKLTITKSTFSFTGSNITYENKTNNIEGDISDFNIKNYSSKLIGLKMREGLNKIIKGTKDDTYLFFGFGFSRDKELKNRVSFLETLLLELQK